MQKIGLKNIKIVKFISVFLCCVLFLTANFITSAENGLTATQFEQKLEEVKKLYPQGSQQYEWKVNGIVVGWQCHGYARWISSYVWGTDFANGTGKGWERYNSTATTTAIDKLVPGDVLRYRTSATKNSNHSIFVTAIDGDTVYFTDCNSDGASTIKWGRTTTKAKLAEHLKMQLADRNYVEYGYIAHYTANTLSVNARLNLNYNTNGGTLNIPKQTITQYTVVSSNGINMRSGAGTEYSVVVALPKGVVFTITESKSDSEGTYIWGKTTYNGKTGWCVISKNWTTKTETEIPPPYYLNTDGNIYITETQKPFEQSFAFGSTYSEGLCDPAEFSLVRENHIFLGWSKNQNGDVVYKHTDSFTPENIFPELAENGGATTLYAVWQSNVVLSSIEVETLPVNTKYLLNAPLDSEGLKIKLNYSNNTSKSITTGFTLNGFDSSTSGEKTITVSYEGKTTTFKVFVCPFETGDLNGDFNVDLSDVISLARLLAGWDVECSETALDVNGDGGVNLLDIVHLSRYVAGWEGVELK